MLFKKNKKELLQDIIMPAHIGIIMDGNGRWAKKRGLPRSAGHSAGAATFKKIAKYCNDIGVKYLTVYAFSSENWRRPKAEVDAIMKLFKEYLVDAEQYAKENIKTRFIGDRSVIDPELADLMDKNEKLSENATGMVLNIAINYGGRAEIINAFKAYCSQNHSSDISEEELSKYLYTSGQPDVDMIIRPSGELRTSNFMIWQSAYAELVFMDILWPDFTTKDLDKAIVEYNKRNRRFGGV